MNWDEVQDVWRSQAALPVKSTLAADEVMLARVRRDARRFDRTIFWRDVREVAAGVVVMGLFGAAAWQWGAAGWPAWIAVGITAAVTCGMVVQRRRLQAARHRFAPTVLGELGWSMHHVRGQIRILHNVAWTYALPLGVAGVLFVTASVLRVDRPGWRGAVVVGLAFAGQAAVSALIAWLNRTVARKTLVPRLRELEQIERDLHS